MDAILPLASALGLGVLAGFRLYATVLVVGLLVRFQWIVLPAAWQHASVLADTRVLVVAAVACAIEFVADKIPWVDSAWDTVHAVIRPVGAVLLSSSLFADLDPVYQVLLCLLAGSAALSGHSAKATLRLAVNHSPEPFSNVVVSLAEDAFVAVGLYLLVKHPWIMAAVALSLLSLAAWLIPRMFRALRAEWTAVSARLRHWFGAVQPPQLSPAQQRWLAEYPAGGTPHRLFTAIATADVKGLRNAVGTLCVTDREAVFFTRSWRRFVARRFWPLRGVETRRRLLLDELALTTPDGRTRFDLPAGQLDRAPDETRRSGSSVPA